MRDSTWAFSIQIYFDFSGYTDIARGMAALLGFRLPEDFRHPYLAANPAEFWRRWDITLSTWLRDYLYIPLGGNRRGRWRTYVNILVTMLLGGLWHGAAWTFVAWGAWHGVSLVVHRIASADSRRVAATPLWLRRIVTFHVVALGWVLFRAGRMDVALDVWRGLVTARPPTGTLPLAALAVVAVGIVTHALSARVELAALWHRLPRAVQGAAYGVVMVVVGLSSADTGRFIYFQF